MSLAATGLYLTETYTFMGLVFWLAVKLGRDHFEANLLCSFVHLCFFKVLARAEPAQEVAGCVHKLFVLLALERAQTLHQFN
jgi:hypothetical protein